MLKLLAFVYILILVFFALFFYHAYRTYPERERRKEAERDALRRAGLPSHLIESD